MRSNTWRCCFIFGAILYKIKKKNKKWSHQTRRTKIKRWNISSRTPELICNKSLYLLFKPKCRFSFADVSLRFNDCKLKIFVILCGLSKNMWTQHRVTLWHFSQFLIRPKSRWINNKEVAVSRLLSWTGTFWCQQEIEDGVPQGSILRPLLYNIYMHPPKIFRFLSVLICNSGFLETEQWLNRKSKPQ